MEKDIDALEQLELIKSTVLDKGGSLPVSGKDLIIWGVISIVLFLVMPLFHLIQKSSSILTSGIFLFILLIFGVVMSLRILKQKNKEKERKFSKYQQLIKNVSIFSIAFGFILTMILSKGFSPFIPLVWMALIGIIFVVEGYFAKEILTKYGFVLIALSFLINIIYLVFFSNYTMALYVFSAIVASLSMGLGMIILGVKFLKEEKLNV